MDASERDVEISLNEVSALAVCSLLFCIPVPSCPIANTRQRDSRGIGPFVLGSSRLAGSLSVLCISPYLSLTSLSPTLRYCSSRLVSALFALRPCIFRAKMDPMMAGSGLPPGGDPMMDMGGGGMPGADPMGMPGADPMGMPRLSTSGRKLRFAHL